MIDRTQAASTRDGSATPTYILSALTLMLLVRGSEKVARWLAEIGEDRARAGRGRHPAD